MLQELLEVERAGHAVHERDHVAREPCLQRGVLEQLVDDHIRGHAALDLHHHAQAITVGLVTHVRNARHGTRVHQLCNLLDQRSLCGEEGGGAHHASGWQRM